LLENPTQLEPLEVEEGVVEVEGPLKKELKGSLD
jgi:hypothetical protein